MEIRLKQIGRSLYPYPEYIQSIQSNRFHNFNKIIMAHDYSWQKIFEYNKIFDHDFDINPYILTSKQIKNACQDFKNTSEKEVRILCKQDSRENRPNIFTMIR
ncbi:type II restriction enzyme [Muribaculum caecicola]|uniref:type II restriction enzyme n=1 Tax=Muribaculum caecicola TaxID=3038144 RepID=UPI003BAED368